MVHKTLGNYCGSGLIGVPGVLLGLGVVGLALANPMTWFVAGGMVRFSLPSLQTPTHDSGYTALEN